MQCPVCKGTNLVMSERQGIEIDYCPQCRGVWLDRGELDKIIEKSASASPVQQAASEPRGYPNQPGYSRDRDYDDDHYRGGHYKKKKRESFLSDLFDF